jgi:hypothetical protein
MLFDLDLSQHEFGGGTRVKIGLNSEQPQATTKTTTGFVNVSCHRERNSDSARVRD